MTDILQVLVVEDDENVRLGCEQALQLEDIPVVGVTARVMARAFARIQTEQRPITVLFPTDIQSQRSRYAPITLVTSSRCQEADPADIGKLADLVEASKRPLIIAGRGAARAGGRISL